MTLSNTALGLLHTVKQRDHYRQVLGLVHRIGRLVNPQHLPGLRERQLSLSQFLVLDALAESKTTCRMTQLAELSGLTVTELSRVVASLEERRWLARTDDEADSRAKLVRLTEDGKRMIRRVRGEATRELGAVWDDFTHEEWHRFIDYLHRFEHGVRRVRATQSVPSTPKKKVRK